MKYARQYKQNLSFKLTAGFIILGILICSTSCTISYMKYKSVIEKLYNDTAYQIAEVARSYINGDDIERYLKTGIVDDKYESMGEKITALRNSMKVNYIYIAKLEGIDLTYIYDVDNPEDQFPPFALGDTGQINPKFREDAKKIVTTGERVDNYFYSHSQFGYNTSAIIPIYNSQNEIIAILGVEIAMEKLHSNMLEYILYAVVLSTILITFFILLYMNYLRRKVVAPINLITREALSFIKHETKVSEHLDKVKTQDEIEHLAYAIKKMEIDINEYIKNLTETTAEKERISAELNIASQIQTSMLPCISPSFPKRKEIYIDAMMRSAKEVGGDFYDFFMVGEDQIAVVIADVSGKGVPAALFIVITKTLIKNQVQAGYSPAEAFATVNSQLCENSDAGMFVTAWMGILDITTGKLTYVNAGHTPPLLKTNGGGFEYLKSHSGFVLAGLKEMNYIQFEIQLHKGDTLFLYTDGITEATNRYYEKYGEYRLLAVLNQNRGALPKTLLKAVVDDVDLHIEDTTQSDDLTMLALTYNGRI